MHCHSREVGNFSVIFCTSNLMYALLIPFLSGLFLAEQMVLKT